MAKKKSNVVEIKKVEEVQQEEVDSSIVEEDERVVVPIPAVGVKVGTVIRKVNHYEKKKLRKSF